MSVQNVFISWKKARGSFKARVNDYSVNTVENLEEVLNFYMDLFAFEDFLLGQKRKEQETLLKEQAERERQAEEQTRIEAEKAATIVESTAKQSLTLVPKDASKLAQRFSPLFNPALFPYKPPTGAVVNQILFTDAEDEFLALEMMEYNTDSKAIQQRFLPCKTKHQDCQAEKSGREKSAGGV